MRVRRASCLVQMNERFISYQSELGCCNRYKGALFIGFMVKLGDWIEEHLLRFKELYCPRE